MGTHKYCKRYPRFNDHGLLIIAKLAPHFASTTEKEPYLPNVRWAPAFAVFSRREFKMRRTTTSKSMQYHSN